MLEENVKFLHFEKKNQSLATYSVTLKKMLFKTLWETEKILETNMIFSFFPKCFLPHQRQRNLIFTTVNLSSANGLNYYDIHLQL